MRKILFFAIAGVALTSCNLTRTVTTTSEYWQKGDTSCIIQSKTVEIMDLTEKLNN